MIDLEDFISTLPANSFLLSIPPVDLKRLLARAKCSQYKAGEVVVRQGEAGDRLLVLLSGLVKICLFCPNGSEIVLTYVSKGGVVGEIAVLDGGPRTACVLAAEASEVLEIDREDLLDFMAQDRQVTQSIIRTLCQRIRHANAMLEDQTTLAAAPRLARTILRLSLEQSPSGAESRVRELKVKQADLGHYARLSRESVSRQLADWAESGLLEIGRGRLVIHDLKSLEDIGNALC